MKCFVSDSDKANTTMNQTYIASAKWKGSSRLPLLEDRFRDKSSSPVVVATTDIRFKPYSLQKVAADPSSSNSTSTSRGKMSTGCGKTFWEPYNDSVVILHFKSEQVDVIHLLAGFFFLCLFFFFINIKMLNSIIIFLFLYLLLVGKIVSGKFSMLYLR